MRKVDTCWGCADAFRRHVQRGGVCGTESALIVSPLIPGIYTGELSCETRATPGEVISVGQTPETVTIGASGLPIMAGQEVAPGSLPGIDEAIEAFGAAIPEGAPFSGQITSVAVSPDARRSFG